MNSDFRIYFITFLLVICTIGYVIPNLLNSVDDLENQTNIIVGTRIDQRERPSKSLETKYEDVLVVMLDNGGELRFTTYDKYWDEIENPANVGKEIKFYKHNGNSGYNPVQVEIDNKIVYEKGEDNIVVYFLLLLTVGCVTYSAYSIRKRLATQ